MGQPSVMPVQQPVDQQALISQLRAPQAQPAPVAGIAGPMPGAFNAPRPLGLPGGPAKGGGKGVGAPGGGRGFTQPVRSGAQIQ